MKTNKVISYALGDVANNLSFMMTSMFLMVFMTEIAGISAGVAGTIYGVTKVWAGITDLFSGQMVDRFDTRWGRLRPWILFGSTPLAIVFVLLFSVPAGLGPTATIAWIFLFDAAFQLCYSLVNIPYGSLSAAMTQDPVDRSKLSGARSIASAVTGVALSAVIAPQFQDTAADGVRLKFTLTCVGLGVLAIILYLICFANAREVVPRSENKVSLRTTLGMIKRNKPLLTLCLGAFFLLGAMFTMNAVGMYYARYVLGNAGWFTFLMLAQTVGTILIASFVPQITARFGKRNGYIAAGLVAIAGYLLIFFMPGGSLLLGIIAWFLLGVGTGGTNSLMFSMQADTVDYGEWVSNTRAEGGSYSILSFIRKSGQGLGGWVGGAVVAAFGYVARADTQSAEALQGIRIATGAVPAILAALALVVMFFYRLDADRHAQVVTELNKRRTQEAVAEHAGVPADRIVTGNVGDGRTMRIRKEGEAVPPIVTVFGQRGSGASEIAPALAEKLGVPYVEQRFSSKTLSQVDRNTLISDSAFSRWMRSVSVDNDAAGIAADREIAANNTAYVLEAVDNGGVLLGRNGAIVLRHVVGALHVRLVAPLGKRVERVMFKTGLGAAEAEEQCHAEDRLRAEMARALYQWDPNTDESYDLVLNTSSVTYDQIVDIIADVYYDKYPQAKRD
ncbi:sugar (Glycoside-Pentoside-Hexuronide) transporter [Corynebacterium pyruviciproducens ATCC BAA-1742]|uniref:Sugar (Glycoside-Pentoside-Hexuronide) transporter n=1 Tax=Corynebacterium pyruviciproducens ATCC BAA-1742 TaxID=1125779 RepID=S2YYN3_9CORY|nr:cytidylate kinase family protein [Corynebacterium pyruviciproducens]EPD69376.1 sugar (Glycoside-Pentoside-Hexuronide) transporter [Corynebacterium pyruviciproducens ATCC BAA-1742]